MNVVFFGPPGAGKGTIAGMVATRTGLPHISTGDLFREAIRDKTPLGNRVKAITESGALVPDEVTIAIVKERLENEDTKNGALLDGFPRTIVQADALSRFFEITAVINLNTDEAVVVRRLSGRRICRACGNIQHIEFLPPNVENVCDKCGGELYQRKDDTVEAIRHRLAVYRDQTEALIGYYRTKDLLIDIDGNADADTVFAAVWEKLDSGKR